MLKKVLLGLVALAAIAGGVAAMSAFEAHVINVTAHIENALSVSTKEIAFGTVFPQEYLEDEFTVSLSSSFLEAERADDVEYEIKQKPKCECDEYIRNPEDPDVGLCPEGQYAPVGYATHQCPTGYTAMLSLCEYLSKQDGDPEDENDVGVPSYFNMPECQPAQWEATGRLAKSDNDTSDVWVLDLKVPPVDGYVGQDWPAGCPVVAQDEQDYGCDLWVEVTDISLTSQGQYFVKTLENKDPDKGWQIVPDDNTWGLIYYSRGEDSLHGRVEAYGLVPNRKYQITLNGQGGCLATDILLGGNELSSDLFRQGYWNGGPGLTQACSPTTPGEGIYNMDVTGSPTGYWTVESDASGNFIHHFDITDLPDGSYSDVKVLVKLMLDTFTSPWVDTSQIKQSNLYETSPINFSIVSP